MSVSGRAVLPAIFAFHLCCLGTLSAQHTSVPPHSVQPNSVQPNSVQPHSVQLNSVQPYSVQPHSVQPVSAVSAPLLTRGSARFFIVLRSDADVRHAAGRTDILAASLRGLLERSGGIVQSLVPPASGLHKGSDVLQRILLVSLRSEDEVEAVMREAEGDPAVEYVQREVLLQVDATVPNDSAWSAQWGTRRIGVPAAWDRSRGAGVTVGVIDTGIDPTHPDLRTQLWINAGEDANGNGRYDAWSATEVRDGLTGDFDGIDNDGNGVIDDVTGYDFVDQPGVVNSTGGDYRDPDGDVTDEMGHGTSVSGIIAAAADNAIGVAGIAPDARLMTLRAFDARGIGGEGDVARALAYAVLNGATVINMSFGDVQYSRVLRDVVRWAAERGAVMVASAGNAQSDAPHYPSAYDETISVSATTSSDALAGFSNYGPTIDIAAPGVDVVTTERDGRYGSFNGTSASAPFVSAAAALLRSAHPDVGPDEIRGLLIAGADDRGTTGWDARYGAGVLNAARSLELDAPSIVRLLTPRTTSAVRNDTIVITGTAASPVMTGFTLEYGVGDNPSRWTGILPLQARQAIAETLFVWNVASLPDTTYVIRLVARSNKGTTLEDRTIVRIDRTPPSFIGVGFIPAVDGRSYGVAAGFMTSEPTLGRIWFRRKGSGDAFEWISAEGGTINNLFVTTTHSAWIGEEHLTPGATYEFYFTATDEAGFTTRTAGPTGNFEFTVPPQIATTGFTRKPYGYEAARLFDRTTDFDGDGRPELVLNTFDGDARLRVLAHDGAAFRDIASGAQRLQYARGVGDVTGDGRSDLLTSFVRNGYLYVADTAGRVPSRLAWADTTSGYFWPAGMVDVDRDGTQEVLAVTTDSTVGVFKADAAGTLARFGTITNPTRGEAFVNPSSGAVKYGSNTFSAPRFAAGDFNNNGKTDLLFGDADGDFFIAEYRLNGEFQIIWAAENDYRDGSDFVAAGDFDDDGRDEFAIGVRTLTDDVIPFWFFGIYSLGAQNTLVERWTGRFHGVEEAASAGTFRRISNSLAAGNVDDTPAPELVLTVFPELYVVKWIPAQNAFDVAFTLPLVNTNAVAIGDFDGNGIPEFACMARDSVEVWERDLPATAPAAVRAVMAAYVAPKQVRLAWTPAPGTTRFRVYKGADATSLAFFTETDVPSLSDFDINAGASHLYAVTAWDTTKTPSESVRQFSRILHPHAQPAVDSVRSIGQGQILITVSQDLGTALPPTSLFQVDAARAPESVAMLGARSLVLTFESMAPGQHGLRIRGLRDGEGIPFLDSEVYPFDVADIPPPACFIERVTFEPPRGFAVQFSGPIDPNIAANPQAYAVSPLGTAVTAMVDPGDPARVHITLGPGTAVGAIGEEYVLRTSGLRCADGSVITGVGANAGVVLNRQTLDDMFVFPNPWNERDGQPFLTFANLTPRAVIRIYTLSGMFVREVIETDGNGGVAWNLDDDQGRRVPGGVYLYHATGTDSQGREVAAHTGKFAIAR